MANQKKLRLGILISGGGTTFLNVHERINAGTLDAEIACVISSRKKAFGLERARKLGYPDYSVNYRKLGDDQAASAAIQEILAEHRVDLVVLAGFLRVFLPGETYANRCINIHPSLIPAFCGQGFYGAKVHEAVYRRGCRVSGCTVHMVNDHYDEGPIIAQQSVALADGDDAAEIQRKVFAAECETLPRVVQWFAEGRIQVENGRVSVKQV
ncbi:phosphoribosylglycinamide formyltransferase [Acanthopleuribacter pedis]|uniref:Phosphoribosylglycinamide formyltransferase n=1 Tax=Acanthopleuribacter pedis TaxID=442870 RepID=A0A8J7QEL5_9BACT|nr:phosphoribosylglycinamide formyltransferase [Acanthopleuribacter pedis]MBO1323217.1 phosphoribosylglycinamide formyltransferase [Acanthopleuribacter pedis]